MKLSFKSVTRGFSSAFKGLTKSFSNLTKSAGKTIETAVSGTAKLATGDISGAIDKYGQTFTNMQNVYTLGTADFTGRKEGIVNINTPGYAKTLLNTVTGKQPKVSNSGSTSTSTTTDESGRIALRKGKGLLGGGSTFLKAKYPLGGSSGQVGK